MHTGNDAARPAEVAARGPSVPGVEAQVRVARRALLAGDEEGALAAVTAAMTHLEQTLPVDGAPLPGAHHRPVLDAHLLVVDVLASLGMHETAIGLLDRGCAWEDDDPLAPARCAYLRVRVEVSWGLRLQRAERDGTAHLRVAADVARALAGEPVPAEHRPLMHAAVVLGRPDPGPEGSPEGSAVPGATARHVAIQDLRAFERLGTVAPTHHDHLVVELARARALARAGRREQAVRALVLLRAQGPHGERDLLLSVCRELVRMRGPAMPHDAGDLLAGYLAELEAELWTLQQARALSLRTHAAHERLRDEHGALAAQAATDPLTGLPNRRALDAFLARHLDGPDGSADGSAHEGPDEGPDGRSPDAGAPVAVAMVDVDDFKRINDHLSHARGDEVLRLVGETLRRALRSDDLVARYGGDEFVVVLPGSGAADAGAALVRAVRAVAEVAVGDGTTVSLSAGVTAVVPVPRRPEEPAGCRDAAVASALDRADAAMYEAKRAGGGSVRVDADPMADGRPSTPRPPLPSPRGRPPPTDRVPPP